MFDPKLPYNDLPFLPLDKDFSDSEISQLLLGASRSLATLNWMSFFNEKTVSELLMMPFLVSESVDSNNIESIHTTVEEYYQQSISSKELSWNNKEVRNYKGAIMYGFWKIADNQMLITNDIIHMQSLIEPNKWWIQSSPDKKIINDSTWETLYTPPQWQDHLLKLMWNLDKYINDDSFDAIDPLIKAIIIHYQFESIHPFLEWNGRTWRMLLVLYLNLKQLLNLPILYISWYINNHKAEYYKHLNYWNRTNDLKPLIKYMLQWIDQQANDTLIKIVEIKNLINNTIETISILKIKKAKELTYGFLQDPYFTLGSLKVSTGIPERTLRNYLNKLEKENIIKKSAWSQWSYIFYELTWLLPIIRQR